MARPQSLITTVIAALCASTVMATPVLGAVSNCASAPGTAALEQYCEQVPAATGGRGSTSKDEAGGVRGRVPESIARRLKAAGPDGEAVLALAEPPPGTTGQARPDIEAKDTRALIPPAAVNAPPESDALQAVTSSIGAGPTTGVLFVGGLIILSIGLLAAAWRRWRLGSADGRVA